MQRVSRVLSRLDVAFDDDKSVASAGLLLPMSIAQELNVESVIDAGLPSMGYGGRCNSGAKALTIVSMLLAGGEFISDVEMLASGATERVLGHATVSASRCGQWLRQLTQTNIESLAQVNSDLISSGWHCGLGPTISAGSDRFPDGQGRLVLDIDSTVIETYGNQKQGTSKRNYRGIKGYHPLIMAEASTSQVVAGVLRDGNAAPAKDADIFVDQALTNIRQTVGPSRETVLRGDSAFYVKAILDACHRHDVRFSITIRQFPNIKKLISSIPPDTYQPLSTTPTKRVDIAEIDYQMKGRGNTNTDPINCRLIIKRTTIPKDTSDPQSRLFDLVDYHGFITDLEGHPAELDEFHRKHAVIESVIKDLKHGMALNHMPSGNYQANAGWLQLNIMAHNLARWTSKLISPTPITTKTLRYRYLNCPGRITRNSRKHVLHLPTNWPWKTQYITALNRIPTLQTAD